MKNGSRTIFEKWIVQADTIYMGYGYMINGGDSMLTEMVSITQEGADVYYIPVVKDQNDGNPVKFKLVEASENRFVFSNPNHDFPQRIIYEFNGADQLNASVEGDVSGKLKHVNFNFVRSAK